jgi:hypothetical protein
VDTAAAPLGSGAPSTDAAGTPAVERSIALDLVRHGAYIAPAVVLLAGAVRGVDGAASAALGLGLVIVNFLATALVMGWAARKSSTVLATAAMGGFIVRMGILLGAMFLADALFGWVDILVLALTVFLAHLGLLFWELRSVSLTLAAPGLRRDRPTPDTPTRATKGVEE